MLPLRGWDRATSLSLPILDHNGEFSTTYVSFWPYRTFRETLYFKNDHQNESLFTKEHQVCPYKISFHIFLIFANCGRIFKIHETILIFSKIIQVTMVAEWCKLCAKMCISQLSPLPTILCLTVVEMWTISSTTFSHALKSYSIIARVSDICPIIAPCFISWYTITFFWRINCRWTYTLRKPPRCVTVCASHLMLCGDVKAVVGQVWPAIIMLQYVYCMQLCCLGAGLAIIIPCQGCWRCEQLHCLWASILLDAAADILLYYSSPGSDECS